MSNKTHCFVHVATMDVDGDLESSSADRWYWCSLCGVLSLNFVTYWLPPIRIPGNVGSRVLPKGRIIAPDCVK